MSGAGNPVSAWLPNMLGFQLCWLAFVAGAAWGRWWLGFVALLPFAAWQLATSRWPRTDLSLVAIAAILGFVIDSLLVGTDLLHYATPLPWSHLAPAWIVGLWMAFALTLNHSLVFLRRSLPAAALLGALAGPFAYWIAGVTWEAVTLHEPVVRALVALAAAWALLTPVLVRLGQRLSLHEAAQRAAAA